MSLKRVTMQDVADACGLSRNTVSKIFNDRGGVPEATRKLVLAKAQELGYFQLPEEPEAPAEQAASSIALLMQRKLLSNNFGAFFIPSFTDQICRLGYSIKMYEVSRTEIAKRQLPPYLKLEDTAGILGIELFDRAYIDMICSLKKPTVFVDGYAQASQSLIRCDYVSMENIASETALLRRMVEAGAERIGFVGDIQHCNSFYERWVGCCAALGDAGLPVDKRLCILAEDGKNSADPEWLLAQLDAMPEMPDAFACANDYLAIQLMTALRKKGLSIPEDVMVVGFDGSLEAAVVSPTLTTARIPAAEIGQLAASLLVERIQNPESPFRWTNVRTTPVWGESTR